MLQTKDSSGFSEAWEDYLRLARERPEAFSQDERMKLVFDRDTVQEYAQRTGKPMGIVYRSPYHIMVVDLVQTPDGKRFAYERLLPAVQRGAVVTVPYYSGRYALLRQFRHALRGEQYAFPRGFAEEGLSVEENAEKELWEELGSHVYAVKRLGTVVADSGISGNAVSVVLCEVGEVALHRDYEGIQDVILLTESELSEWIAAGKIDDGFTLAAFALLQSRH